MSRQSFLDADVKNGGSGPVLDAPATGPGRRVLEAVGTGNGSALDTPPTEPVRGALEAGLISARPAMELEAER